MRRGTLLAIASALVALLLLPALAHATNPARAIVVFGGDPPNELTAIKELRCRVLGGGRAFEASGRSPDGWRLKIKATTFDDGFGEEFPIAYGIRNTNFQLFPTRSSTPFYSNLFFPGETPPPLNGELAISGNGRKLGFGFGAAFSSTGAQDDAVAVVGNARCRYPRR